MALHLPYSDFQTYDQASSHIVAAGRRSQPVPTAFQDLNGRVYLLSAGLWPVLVTPSPYDYLRQLRTCYHEASAVHGHQSWTSRVFGKSIIGVARIQQVLQEAQCFIIFDTFELRH